MLKSQLYERRKVESIRENSHWKLVPQLTSVVEDIVFYASDINGYVVFMSDNHSTGVERSKVQEVTHSQQIPVSMVYGNRLIEIEKREWEATLQKNSL